ncbi:hypothetical protein CY0110_16532 [Crocosphaera chwakensis CCY0110]|uniref:Uncharacterized protein n=1 Tax=Crocosphaera chwakensis CCY0110 TaxID=391612 RepID=A3IHY8_9CHRO|nr:hypothetical protein CY0110_16532 [Crocosphaera chwakensis CCY0110]
MVNGETGCFLTGWILLKGFKELSHKPLSRN